MLHAERGGDDDEAAESPFPESRKAGSMRAQMARAWSKGLGASMLSISGI